MSNIIDFYNNATSYTPPCCRPGGRCTTRQATPDTPLSEDDEHKLSEFINSGASMRDVLTYWHQLKEQA